MSVESLPSPEGVANAVRLFLAARPDEALGALTAEAESHERDAAAALAGNGPVTRHFKHRRRAAWLVALAIEALAEPPVALAIETEAEPPAGPTLPLATPADVLESWARQRGSACAAAAVTYLASAADQAEAKAKQLRAVLTGEGSSHLFRRNYHGNGGIDTGVLDSSAAIENVWELAERYDKAEASAARAAAARNAGAAVAAKLAESAITLVRDRGPVLETGLKTAAALATDPDAADPGIAALRARKAELESELGRLASFGVKAGPVSGESADELKAVNAEIKARVDAVGAAAGGDAAALVKAVKSGDGDALARLIEAVRRTPRAFPANTADDLMNLAVAAVQAGGAAAAAILAPNG